MEQDKSQQQKNGEQSPVPPKKAEQTSEHAPLPIGCTALDDEEQRMWDNFCKQGQVRDRQSEAARQLRKQQMAQSEEKQDTRKPTAQQKHEVPAASPMQRFMRNLENYHRPHVAKKINLQPQQIEEYLTVAYQKECAKRRMQPVMDNYTTATISNVSRWLSVESHTKGSLLLRGYVGVGKTTMLCAIRSLFIGLGLPGFPIKSAFDINALAKDKEQFDEMKRAEFLGIDDLGQEPATIKDYGNERNPFEELISARYDALKQTLISTNLVVVDGNDQIAERYGTRVADRLREMCNTINYDPQQQSYRK